ncbi:MAG: hypothetical protein JNN30_15595 [Rhodanobacteraceae bacterium]|nr:hypothetical protein [Rhodanobacteraceae bacterium]
MGEHQRLKELLLGEELAELNAQAERVAALEATQAELPKQLPALLQRAQRGNGRRRLAQALAAPVADALGAAVASQRQHIVDALFPVIGPAIRKAIAEALRDFTENFNRALESSLTLRGLRWRFESWRTGIPYAQVVLRHSLRYRIDHLFLIDRENGLVLARVSAPDLPDLDADAIAGMLTAIGDFVRDSVGDGEGGGLDAASLGEHLVWVLPGPRANLAAFLRGAPPAELRAVLYGCLEQIHQRLDDSALDSAALAEVIKLDSIDAAAAAQAPTSASSPRRWPLLVLVFLLFGSLVWWQWREWAWQQRIEAITAVLANWPGLHLDRIDGRAGREVRVVGLVDADAEPLEPTLRTLLPSEVDLQLLLRGFVSTDDPVVLQRVRRELDLPSGVQASVHSGVASLQGSADAAWIAQAKLRAERVVGLVALDTSLLQVSVDPAEALRAEWQRLSTMLPDLRVHFVRELEPRDPAELQHVVTVVQRLVALASELRRPLQLQCFGHNDEPGSAKKNRELRYRRAQWLCERLREADVVASFNPATNRPAADVRAASLWLDVTAPEEE